MPDETGFVSSIKEIKILTQSHRIKYPEHAALFENQLSILENQFVKYPNLDRETVENAVNEILYLKTEFDDNYIPDINGDSGTIPFNYAKDIAQSVANFLRL